jgi:hypothetical protein
VSGYDGMDDGLDNLISLDSPRENKGLGQGIPIFAIVHRQSAWNRTYPLASLHTLAEQPLRIESSEFRRSSSADVKLSKGKYQQTDRKTIPRAQRDRSYLS